MKTILSLILPCALTSPNAFCLENETNSTPIGSIQAYVGYPESLPPNWVICDGRSLAVASNLKLFKVIGWRFGLGTNSDKYSTFGVPDLRNRFMQGAGDNLLGSTGGKKEIPMDGGHTPQGSVSVWKAGPPSPAGFQGSGGNCVLPGASFSGNAVPSHNHGGDSRPPFLTVYYIMKVE